MKLMQIPKVVRQGRQVRESTELLPQASGPTRGTAGRSWLWRPLRMTVIGESTAAGSGASMHEEAFAGRLAHYLVEETGRAVDWHVVGENGATINRTQEFQLPSVGTEIRDVCVLLTGVNDVINRTRASYWREDLSAVVDTLALRCELVVVAGLPDFTKFPALPSELGDYLASRANALDTEARRICGAREGVLWTDTVDAMKDASSEFFAHDGFHPGPVGYDMWARAVAREIVPELVPARAW